MKDIKHLLVVASTFVVVIGLFLLVRRAMIPKSFGRYGHYRADAAEELKTLPVKYAGRAACGPCHSAQTKTQAAGAHRTIGCESCHGPLAAHIENPGEARPFKPAEAEVRSFCGKCHEYNSSRPKKFPQVVMGEHNPGLACTLCHNPHTPRL